MSCIFRLMMTPATFVGIDPVGAAGLRGSLDDAAQALEASAVRIQRLLDEAGVTCGVPMEVRGVARSCTGTAEDLAGRIGLSDTRPVGRWHGWTATFPLPSWSPRETVQGTFGLSQWFFGTPGRFPELAVSSLRPAVPGSSPLDGVWPWKTESLPGYTTPRPVHVDQASAAIPPGSRTPEEAFPALQGRFGIPRGSLSDAFHKIKKGAGLQGPDSTRIDEEGNVYVTETGEDIGNVIDEAHG